MIATERSAAWLLGALIAITAGCQRSVTPPAPAASSSATSTGSSSEVPRNPDTAIRTSSETAVHLTDLDDVSDLQAHIAQHRGKVVVVDMWATWCPPCVAEFPRLVELQQRQGEKVVCISLSFDYDGLDTREATRAKVLRFLEKHQARLVNLFSTLDADRLLRELDLPSLPVVDVYDPAGGRRQRFDASYVGEFSYDDVNRLVDELLSESPGP